MSAQLELVHAARARDGAASVFSRALGQDAQVRLGVLRRLQHACVGPPASVRRISARHRERRPRRRRASSSPSRHSPRSWKPQADEQRRSVIPAKAGTRSTRRANARPRQRCSPAGRAPRRPSSASGRSRTSAPPRVGERERLDLLAARAWPARRCGRAACRSPAPRARSCPARARPCRPRARAGRGGACPGRSSAQSAVAMCGTIGREQQDRVLEHFLRDGARGGARDPSRRS